jgi:hypothetical protein
MGNQLIWLLAASPVKTPAKFVQDVTLHNALSLM